MSENNIDEDEIVSKYLDTGIWMLLLVGFSYFIFWIIWGQPIVAYYCLVHGIISIFLLFYKKFNVSKFIVTNIILAMALEITLGLNLFLVKTIPILSVYFCVIPITSILILGIKKSRFWLILSIILLLFVIWIGQHTSVEVSLNKNEILNINTIQTVTLYAIFMIFILLYENRKRGMFDSLSRQNKAINIAKDELEKTQKYKDNFMASISHEIRTPMNAIKGISELLEQSECGKGEEKELISALNNSSIHLLNIINDLLDLGKIDERKLNILSLDINLKENIEIGTKMVQFAANEKKLSLEIHFDESLPKYVKGDPHRLNQILVNILNNAVKFTKEGKVTLDVKKQIIANTKWLEMKITDTGIGIAKDSYHLIFERFKQSNDYISLKYGGTGLGLNISKGLVDLMNGSIWFESELGVGTTFFVRLPLIESLGDHITDLNNEIIKKTIETNDYKILLVDDNNLNLLVAEKLLLKSFEKINIYRAMNGQEAIDKLIEFPEINMILMDLQMPVMDGKEATKKIRKMKSFEKIPIIAMSAAINQSEIDECTAVGMNDFIGKPFDKNSLLMLIRKHF